MYLPHQCHLSPPQFDEIDVDQVLKTLSYIEGLMNLHQPLCSNEILEDIFCLGNSIHVRWFRAAFRRHCIQIWTSNWTKWIFKYHTIGPRLFGKIGDCHKWTVWIGTFLYITRNNNKRLPKILQRGTNIRFKKSVSSMDANSMPIDLAARVLCNKFGITLMIVLGSQGTRLFIPEDVLWARKASSCAHNQNWAS